MEQRKEKTLEDPLTELAKRVVELEKLVADHEVRFEELAGPKGHRKPKDIG